MLGSSLKLLRLNSVICKHHDSTLHNFVLLLFSRRCRGGGHTQGSQALLCACGGGGKECEDKSQIAARGIVRPADGYVADVMFAVLCVLLYEAKCLHTGYTCMVCAYLWMHVFLSVFGLKSPNILIIFDL